MWWPNATTAAAAPAACAPLGNSPPRWHFVALGQSTLILDDFLCSNALRAGTTLSRNLLALRATTTMGELDACQDHICGGHDAPADGWRRISVRFHNKHAATRDFGAQRLRKPPQRNPAIRNSSRPEWVQRHARIACLGRRARVTVRNKAVVITRLPLAGTTSRRLPAARDDKL